MVKIWAMWVDLKSGNLPELLGLSRHKLRYGPLDVAAAKAHLVGFHHEPLASSAATQKHFGDSDCRPMLVNLLFSGLNFSVSRGRDANPVGMLDDQFRAVARKDDHRPL